MCGRLSPPVLETKTYSFRLAEIAHRQSNFLLFDDPLNGLTQRISFRQWVIRKWILYHQLRDNIQTTFNRFHCQNKTIYPLTSAPGFPPPPLLLPNLHLHLPPIVLSDKIPTLYMLSVI